MRYYEMKYRLPMSHSSSAGAQSGHHHILEIAIRAEIAERTEHGQRADGDGWTEEAEIEQSVRMEHTLKECLDGYREQFLNSMEEFGGDASIENITEVFYQKIAKAFSAYGFVLTRIEVGENPLRVCLIEQRSGKE